MSLTPVRVRGKRKTPCTKPPKALQQQQENQRQTGKKTKRAMATVLATRRARDRPSLDALPAEILETILLYSTNLSLPHASPVIGLKLSERATLIRFFIWAFHETWDQWFGVPTSKTLLHGPPVFGRHNSTQCKGDYALQTAVLKQQWATIDFILQAQQTWADNHAQDRWYQHSVPWDDDPDELCHARNGGASHFNAHRCFEVDFQQALKWDPFKVESLPWGGQDIHPKTRIPDNLITGPWTEEQQRRLFWLARGGMLVANQGFEMPPWEMKMEFLRNAVLDVTRPNMIAINCLMGSWVFQDLPGDVVRKEVSNIERRLKWGDDTHMMRGILQRTRNAMNMFLEYRQARRSSV